MSQVYFMRHPRYKWSAQWEITYFVYMFKEPIHKKKRFPHLLVYFNAVIWKSFLNLAKIRTRIIWIHFTRVVNGSGISLSIQPNRINLNWKHIYTLPWKRINRNSCKLFSFYSLNFVNGQFHFLLFKWYKGWNSRNNGLHSWKYVY